jgi:hypothetical protein
MTVRDVILGRLLVRPTWRTVPIIVCACGVTTEPIRSQDTAGPAAEPIPVLLNDAWMLYTGPEPVWLGPYDGAPPMLLELALQPDDLQLRVQAGLGT